MISEDKFRKKEETIEKRAQNLFYEELLRRIATPKIHKATQKIMSERYVRDQNVSVFAKRRAKGRCQLCETAAPFLDKKKRPYLEVHHIDWLSKGGGDRIDNAIALCPNCHRKMHILNLKSDKTYLRERVQLTLQED